MDKNKEPIITFNQSKIEPKLRHIESSKKDWLDL